MSGRRRRKRDWLELTLLALIVVGLVYVSAGQHSERRRLRRQASELATDAQEIRSAVRQIGSQHTQLVDACTRLQIVRVQDNASHYADWRVFRVVLIGTEAAAVVSRQEARFNHALLPVLRAAIGAKTWVPITNCAQAVSRFGSHYRPPHPIPFNRRLPPSSALHLPTTVYR